MTADHRQPLPPYLPYKTFINFLDHLHAIGVPSHIDKSVMTSYSGAMQTWLKAALRYLALIDRESVPTPELAKLAATKPEERKVLLQALFRKGYGFLNGKVDLKNTTPQKLKATVGELGAQGETVEKIVAFMVAMGKDTGVQLSPLLSQRAPALRRPRQRAPRQDKADTQMNVSPAVSAAQPEPAMKKTIQLRKSGGSVTLSGDVNLFALHGDERELVFALIDKMSAFEMQNGGDPE